MPLVLLIADAALGQLGAEPVRPAAILRTGKAALVQLALSLACTPLNTLFGFKAALESAPGVGAVCLHVCRRTFHPVRRGGLCSSTGRCCRMRC